MRLERRRERAAYESAATQGLRFGECKREVEILPATLVVDQNPDATPLTM
jgi:hypothetical protein